MEPTGGVITREFVLDDYDGTIALWNSVEGVEICEGDSREEIAEYLKRNPGLSRVAEADGKIVGVALCGHDGRRGWIYHLAVAQGLSSAESREVVDGRLRGGIAKGRPETRHHSRGRR